MTDITSIRDADASTRTGISYLDTTVYLFKSYKAPSTGRTITLGQGLRMVQESRYSEQISKARQSVKGSANYEKVKKRIPCFSWNVSYFQNNYRKSEKAKQLSGLIYFDRDTAGDIQDLAVIPELVCAWHSFGGIGDGFIVAVDGLTIQNFKSTWAALQARFKSFGLEIDASCSNIDRANVLSSSDIYLQDEVTPFKAVEPQAVPQPGRERKEVTILQDTDQIYTRLKKWLENKGEFYGKGTRNRYLVKLAAACNRYGIDQNDAADWMVQDFEYAAEHVPADEIRKKTAAIYDSFKTDFDTQAFKETRIAANSQKSRKNEKKPAAGAGIADFGHEKFLTYSVSSLYKTQESEKNKEEKEELLNPGQRLSDLNLDFSKSQYIDSPTGAGKTAAVILSGTSFDMVVPTQDQAKQVGHEYKIDYVSEGRQSTDKQQQIGTYNALEKFVQRDTSQRTLVIDEAHNLALSQGYRSEVLNNILDQAAKYRNVVLLSGTPVKSCHPLLKSTPTTRVRKTEAPRKDFQAVIYRDRDAALIKRLEPGKLQTIVLQDKVKGETLAELLRGKGYAVQCFNADTKEESHHREIIEQCSVNEEIEVLIVTGLFFEGLNIYNTEIGAVHLLSTISRYDIAQLFDRYRHQAPERLIQYRPKSANVNQEVDFDWDATQAYWLNIATAFAAKEVIPSGAVTAASEANEILKGIAGKLKCLTRFSGNAWQVNYLGVDYLTVEAERKAMHSNLSLMAELLAEYGFVLSATVEDEVQDNCTRKQLAVIADNQREAERKSQADLLEIFEQGGMGYVIEAEKSRNTDDAKTARRILELEKYMPFSQVMEFLKRDIAESPLTDNRFRLLRDQARVQRYLQLKKESHTATPETRMIEAICNLFQVGGKYTADEIKTSLQKIRSKHFRTKYLIFTNPKAIRVLKQFFDVKRGKKLCEESGQWVNCYEVLSSNPLKIWIDIPSTESQAAA